MNGTAAYRWKAVRGSAWLPLGALLMALSTVFLFVDERGHFYSSYGTVSAEHQNHDTAKNMALVANLSPERGFLFHYKWRNANGEVRYRLYNRFPIGAFVLVKFATAPFHGDLFARVVAARTLMLAFFCAAAVLAYLALAAMAGRGVALVATLLGFSSYHMLDYNDVVSNEMSVGLFGMMLVLHGIVRFREDGRFRQLVVKVCVALLLDWHVYGLLLPFLALGIVREAWTGWGNVAGAGTPLARVRGAAGQVLRSRSALLGALALLFGIGVLGYNLMQEYAVFDGQRAVADLPSAKSMAKRTWEPPSDSPEYVWPTFLEWQLHRVGTMVIPFGLATGIDFDESEWRESGAPSLVALGLVCAIACLAGLALLPRHRATLAALALSGCCWALLARGSTAEVVHQFEAMFYVGVPLVLFAALFSLAQRRWPRWAGFAGAAAAVLIFVWSSVAMGLTQRDLGKERAGRALMAEFDAVTGAIQGKTVLLPKHRLSWSRFLPHPTTRPTTINVLTAGAFVQEPRTVRLDAVPPPAAPALDFVIAFERFELPSLLTPSHRTVFLYEAGSDAGGVLQAMLAARRADWRRLNTTNLVALVAQSAFDIRFVPRGGGHGGELAFLRAPCVEGDTHGPFHVRAWPVRAADLAPWRARLGFHHRPFSFPAYGDVFDGKCLMRVPLPPWPVANVRVSQYKLGPLNPEPRGLEWHASFRLDWDRLRTARHAALAREPTARRMFDVYASNGELIYLRAPCAAQDVRPRFFLHVFPDVGNAEPEAAGRFDNLDFDFPEHGALIDGGCVVLLTLPREAAWVRTGQFDPVRGVIWQAEFAPGERPGDLPQAHRGPSAHPDPATRDSGPEGASTSTTPSPPGASRKPGASPRSSSAIV